MDKSVKIYLENWKNNIIKNKKKLLIITGVSFLVVLVGIVTIKMNTNEKTVATSNQSMQDVSNKKICWGIKRNDKHEQPDFGKTNKELLEEYGGIAIGNSKKKYVYLTFDEGYEAGYTAKILDILKENNVKAAFFITGHYLNSASDLVKRMIDEGHIVRKPYSKSL